MNEAVARWARQQDQRDLKRRLVEAFESNDETGSAVLYKQVIASFRADTGLQPADVSDFAVMLGLGGWLMTHSMTTLDPE